MYENYVNSKNAFELLQKYNYGVALDAYGNIYLAPIIRNPSAISNKEIEFISKVVNIHNKPVLVADDIMIPKIRERVVGLIPEEKKDLEKKLGFEIPKGKCGITISDNEFKELGITFG